MTQPSFATSVLNTIVGLTIATAGGVAFHYLKAPLPWTLGPLFATAVMAVMGGTFFLPKLAWTIARPSVGVLAGSAFTLPVILSIPQWWDSLLALLIYSVIVTYLGWLFFSRACRYDDVTAFFASAPGGLGELTILGESLGGSMRTLVLIHAVRVVLMVFIVPFIIVWFFLPPGMDLSGVSGSSGTLSPLDWAILIGCCVAGYFIGRPFTSIGGVMLAPMGLSAAVHIAGISEAAPPFWLVAALQVVIGAISGSRFAGISWPELRSTVLYAVVWAVFLLAAAVGAAWICTLFTDESLLALILAFTPGGIVEMTIIAYALSLHVAFVVALQTGRVVAVLLITPLLFKTLKHPRLPGEPDDKA